MKAFVTSMALLLCLAIHAQPEETEQQKSMAKQMASYMDMAWEAEPESGMANLRILFLKDGKPYSGVTSVHGRINFVMQGRRNYSTSINPNDNGRYVYEGIEPGTYKLLLSGKYELEGFSYEQSNLVIKEGEQSLLEIELP